MSDNCGMENKSERPVQGPSVRQLRSDTFRIPLEQCVSAHLGREWRVREAQNRTASASHPAAILSDTSYGVFVKLGEGSLAFDQFEKELAGLRYLTERSGVLTPVGIGKVQVGDAVLLILEAVQVVEGGHNHWRQMGRALAAVHNVKGDRFGFGSHCYWGNLYQDNTPHADWVDFFRQRRLATRLRAAVDSGNLPLNIVPQMEKLSARLPELCGPKVEPSLLHGDAHQNNFLSTARGSVLIDPAVYYGHPEMDLAMVDFFAPVSEALLQAFRELAPLHPGFADRRDLWRVPVWLAMVEVDGPQYLDNLVTALRKYV
jgi:protein-ribulosamine 3-kinase